MLGAQEICEHTLTLNRILVSYIIKELDDSPLINRQPNSLMKCRITYRL